MLVAGVIATGLVGVLGAGAAEASGTTTVTVTLAQPVIPDDGASMTSITVNVSDSSGPVVNDPVGLLTTGDETFAQQSGATDANGNFMTTVQAGTTEGLSTIEAFEFGGAQGTADLFQYAGSVSISMALSPPTITADGASSTTATATVQDGNHLPIPNDIVTISSSGPQLVSPSPATSAGDGTYSATVVSTTTPGQFSMSATDQSLGTPILTPATLTQVPGPPAKLSIGHFAPASVTANGSSTTQATVLLTDGVGNGLSGDASALTLSSSDPSVHTSLTDDGAGTYGLSVTSSTTAHPVTVTLTLAGLTTSQTFAQVAGPATNVSLGLSPSVINANGFSTSTASIHLTDTNGNAVTGDPVHVSTDAPRVHVGSVSSKANGTYLTTLTSTNIPRAVQVTATDTKTGHSGQATLTLIPAPSLTSVATMQWTFLWGPRSTLAKTLRVDGTPIGGTVKVLCSGKGCPFKIKTLPVQKHKCPKGKKHKGCQVNPPVNLARLFANRRLKAGTKLTVEVLRRGWIGKYYFFQIRPATSPRISISCLAPGGSNPGAGCS